ncbi:lytic murein transglycosylase [Halomonas heilongjiangensis]|uniref:Lytic murein transglycosylase n=1 Tax=Halomonas heilongjiangensis TaxID=1387883 RepID=A0A2N7TPH8_9GAMM|nr:lytic murein transglycosylase [Halomonas heilongjiangensis]PMR70008.1 lytic murein transglycosylase [Halomonas heilongjiangensis]PXX94372.1 murein transglycosylase [Halomonas heilongjiangensis]
MRRILTTSVLLALLAGCQSSPTTEASAADRDAEGAEAAAAPSPAAPENVAEVAPPSDFPGWLAGFRRDARAEGISESTLARALDGVRYRSRVIELDRSQPEFVRPIWQYLDSAVSAQRVTQGRERLSAHRDTARRMERHYGVPAEVIVAIWGIESNYGSNFGDFSTLDALATLAFDGRRRDFARGELLAALRILDQGDIAPERMVGSWAGAMGHTQFIPSSFESYAVDGDGDGRRDIWGSIPDVMASTANYLARAGWQSGEPWGVEVRLPEHFDHAQTELATRHSSQEWADQGVRAVSGGSLPEFAAASVIAPAGARGPAFLVGPNYRAILRYNNATSYALAVGTLADEIAGREGVVQGWPRDEQPLMRSQVREMQQALNARGFDVGTPDGIMGPNTRRGLRAFQQSIDVTPDGFATVRLLERLKR